MADLDVVKCNLSLAPPLMCAYICVFNLHKLFGFGAFVNNFKSTYYLNYPMIDSISLRC